MIKYWQDSATKSIHNESELCGMQYYCDVLAMKAFAKFYREKISNLELKIYP
jgi:hypothetical protein